MTPRSNLFAFVSTQDTFRQSLAGRASGNLRFTIHCPERRGVTLTVIMKYITSLLLLTVIVHLTKCIQRPRYIECQDSNECPGDSCCVMGTGRYSIPTCKTYQDINEPCHPGQIQPLNTTVSYLDGAVVDYSNVFIQYCQCAVGLACENKTLTCQDPSTNPNFNFLD